MLTVTLALCTLVATGANIEQDTTLRMTPHQQKLFQAIHGLDGQSDFINPKLRELQRHHRTPKATMFKKIRELQQHHRQPRAAMLRCSTPATSHMDTSMGRSESPMSALSDDSLALSGTSDDLGSSRFIPLFLNQEDDIRSVEEKFSRLHELYEEMAVYAKSAVESLSAASDFKILDMESDYRREIEKTRKELVKIQLVKYGEMFLYHLLKDKMSSLSE